MRLDPGPFVAKAEAAAGDDVELCVDAKRRREGDVVGRSGVLCLTGNAAVFVEDRILQPGAVHLVREPRLLASRRDYLGAEFEVGTADGVVVYAGIEEARAEAVARGFARIALGPLLADDGDTERPITAEVFGEPDDDDLEIEADDDDIEESVEIEARAVAAAQAQRVREQPTNRVLPAPVVEVDPIIEIEPMPERPRPRAAAAAVVDLLLVDHLPAKLAIEIQWKHDRFVVHGRDFVDGIAAGRFGKGTRFRVDGSSEPFVSLGDTRLYDLHRPGGDVEEADDAAATAARQPTTT